MKRWVFVSLFLFPVSGFSATQAMQWSCTQGAMTRTVSVVLPTEGADKCRVEDTRIPGATPQVLWRASNDPHFCTAKAETFVNDRLKALNWNCATNVQATNQQAPTTTEVQR